MSPEPFPSMGRRGKTIASQLMLIGIAAIHDRGVTLALHVCGEAVSGHSRAL